MPNFRHRLVKMNMKLDIYTPDVGNTGGKKLIYKTRGNGRMERPRNIWAGPNWPTHMFKKIDSDTTCRHKELFFCSHFVVAPQLVLLTRLPDFGELVWFQVVLPQAPPTKLVSKFCSLPPTLKPSSLHLFLLCPWPFWVNTKSAGSFRLITAGANHRKLLRWRRKTFHQSAGS